MNELKAILDASDASAAVKNQALVLSLEIGIGLAQKQAAVSAGEGVFFALLMELLKLLLPLLLELLKPKV